MDPQEHPIAERGVYCQPYLRNAKREYYAVDSRGEIIAVRWVPRSRDPKYAIRELWEELHLHDPVNGHDRPPFFPLLVRGLVGWAMTLLPATPQAL